MQQTSRPRALLQRVLGRWVADVDRRTLRADAAAGLLGAVLALPQAIAFASLAGLPPAWGLYTAVVPCAVAALAGSSRLVMSGPTNAVSLAIAAMLGPLGVAAGAGALAGVTAGASVAAAEHLRLVAVATLMVGLLQAALALSRLSVLVHFIAPSVLLGFTSGAAVLIAWHAVDGWAGIPAEWAIGIATLALAWAWRATWRRGPTLLLALACTTLAAWALSRWGGVALAHVGALPRALPPWRPPSLQWADVPRLASTAFALTVVALGQSIAIAKVLAARTGQPLDVSRECFGQGLSNIVGACCSCFVSSGSLNRSLPSLQSGASTPLAAVFSAVLVLLLALLGGPLMAWVPLAAIGGLLLWVAGSLIDRAEWRRLLQFDHQEAAIAAATFFATLVLPLQDAVLGGVGLSLAGYLLRTSRPALRTMGFDSRAPGRAMVVVDGAPPGALPECPQLKLLRMEGAVFFGAVPHVSDHLQALRNAGRPQRHLLVMAKSMNFVDDAGATLWADEHARRLAIGGDLYFHRPRPEVLRTWQQRGFIATLGADHVFADKRGALATIVPRLDGRICAGCTVRLFGECAAQPAPPSTAAAAAGPPAGAAP